MVDFVRQLLDEPGIQLSPTRDESEVFVAGNEDQIAALVGRFTRGALTPFVVSKGDFRRRLGKGEALRKNALNEAYTQAYEMLNQGASALVVQRLITSTHALKWIVVKASADAKSVVFSVEAALPASGFILAIKHHECFNEGIIVEISAEEKTDIAGALIPSDVVSIILRDIDGNALYGEFKGSLSPDAKTDYGTSYHLPVVVESRTKYVEVITGDVATIATTSSIYGWDLLNRPKSVKSPVQVYFTEGGTGYAVTDYQDATDKLYNAHSSGKPFGYISSGGSRNPALLYQLAQLAYQTNIPFDYDIPGDLDVDGAVAFANQLSMESSMPLPDLVRGIWCPVKRDDPLGMNPRGFFGGAHQHIAKSCARNAIKNVKGYAAKNFPVAGRNYPLSGIRMEQMCFLDQRDLNKLAQARIIPVVFETYDNAGLFIYRDILTAKPSKSSALKLISVSEMAHDLELRMTRFDKANMFLPMDIFIQRKENFLTEMLEGAQFSGWLVPSREPEMDGRAWTFSVQPAEDAPYDTAITLVKASFDGAVRQLKNQFTVSR